ncbi:MAG TPA: hypothetical protein VIV11_41865 [Kofleriaceae bacterium]
MKKLARITGVLAVTLTSSLAFANDTKNVGGLVCVRYADSAAPKSAEYITYGGKMCNDSSSERLKVTCPLPQDMGTGEAFSITIDYVNWQSLAQNPFHDPAYAFECSGFSRDRYAQAYYWGGWQNVKDAGDNWGDVNTALSADVNAMLDNGFSHAVCFIPQKTGAGRSCVSHIMFDEHL